MFFLRNDIKSSHKSTHNQTMEALYPVSRSCTQEHSTYWSLCGCRIFPYSDQVIPSKFSKSLCKGYPFSVRLDICRLSGPRAHSPHMARWLRSRRAQQEGGQNVQISGILNFSIAPENVALLSFWIIFIYFLSGDLSWVFYPMQTFSSPPLKGYNFFFVSVADPDINLNRIQGSVPAERWEIIPFNEFVCK